MSDRYPHVVIGPNSSNRCSFCLCRFDDFSRLGECPIRLRQALNDAQAVIAEDDATGPIPGRVPTVSVQRLFDAQEARRPHVAAHLLQVAISVHRCPRPADGPRTAKEWIGRYLTFAPADDACTVCDHCGAGAEEHGLPGAEDNVWQGGRR